MSDLVIPAPAAARIRVAQADAQRAAARVQELVNIAMEAMGVEGDLSAWTITDGPSGTLVAQKKPEP